MSIPVGTQPTIALHPVSLILPVGATPFGATTLGALYSTVSFTLDRNAAWADSAGLEILDFLVDVSFDARATWQVWCGFGVSGGAVTSPLKGGGSTPVTAHSFIHRVPAPCDVRGHLINRTAAVIQAITVTVACN